MMRPSLITAMIALAHVTVNPGCGVRAQDLSQSTMIQNLSRGGSRLPKTSSYYYMHHWDWLNEHWNTSPDAFANARASIDALVKSGADPAVIARKYAPAAQKHPGDALLVFKFSYASYLAAEDPKVTSADRINTFESLENPLAIPDSPYSYDYDRLRVLVMSSYGAPWLIPISWRLFRRDPDDEAVTYALVSQLTTGSISDMAEAKVVAGSLLMKHPTIAKFYALNASVYRRSWFKIRDQADALKAIQLYQKFLQVAGPNDGFRSSAEAEIAWIKQKANIS